jgi:hypothetical protein
MRAPRNKHPHGIFEPSQVDDMQRKLKRGDTPDESKAAREQRAAAIVQREMMQPGGDTKHQRDA